MNFVVPFSLIGSSKCTNHVIVHKLYAVETLIQLLTDNSKHQIKLNNRPVGIPVGDIYSPKTNLFRLAANTHNRVTPVSRKSITKALFPKK